MVGNFFDTCILSCCLDKDFQRIVLNKRRGRGGGAGCGWEAQHSHHRAGMAVLSFNESTEKSAHMDRYFYYVV